MTIIYIYTTETYQKNNWFKIGQTTTDPLKRVQEQDNASNPEKLKLLKSWKTEDWVTDKRIHTELEKLGFLKVRNNREWFELSEKPEEDIAAVLNDIKATATPILRLAGGEIIPTPEIPHHTELWWYKGGNPPLCALVGV
jgi:hypothetical protein